MTELLDILIYGIAAGVMGLLGWAVRRFATTLELDIDDSQRRVLEQVMARAIALAVQSRFPGSPPNSPAMLAQAIDYLARNVPEALAHFGIDPRTEPGRAKLREMILARLPATEAPATMKGARVEGGTITGGRVELAATDEAYAKRLAAELGED